MFESLHASLRAFVCVTNKLCQVIYYVLVYSALIYCIMQGTVLVCVIIMVVIDSGVIWWSCRGMEKQHATGNARSFFT